MVSTLYFLSKYLMEAAHIVLLSSLEFRIFTECKFVAMNHFLRCYATLKKRVKFGAKLEVLQSVRGNATTCIFGNFDQFRHQTTTLSLVNLCNKTLRHFIMLLEQISTACASVVHEMLSNVSFMCKTAFHLL